METAAQQIQSSRKLKWLLVYVAVITTLSVFLLGYNQSKSCTTQRSNVAASNIRNAAIDTAITEQIKLYRIVLEGTLAEEQPNLNAEQQKRSDQFVKTLDGSIVALQDAKEIIAETPSQPVQCFIVGSANSDDDSKT